MGRGMESRLGGDKPRVPRPDLSRHTEPVPHQPHRCHGKLRFIPVHPRKTGKIEKNSARRIRFDTHGNIRKGGEDLIPEKSEPPSLEGNKNRVVQKPPRILERHGRKYTPTHKVLGTVDHTSLLFRNPSDYKRFPAQHRIIMPRSLDIKMGNFQTSHSHKLYYRTYVLI